jgi:hypothetical protein
MNTKKLFRMFSQKIVLCSFCLFLFLVQACESSAPRVSIEQVKDADQADDWRIEVQYPVFSSSDPATDKSLRVLNGQVAAYVSVLEDSLKIEAHEVFEGFKNDNLPRPEWVYEFGVRDSVFTANSGYISLRLSVYRYTGGAHGMTNYVAFNYDVEKQKMLTTAEILNIDETDAINGLMKAYFENPSQCFDTDPTLDVVSSVNFSPEAVCFLFEQYVLGAYTCGPAEVTVPKAELGANFLLK